MNGALVKGSILVRQHFCINYIVVIYSFCVNYFVICFFKYSSFLFIECFDIMLSVCACKNLLGPQLFYVQFVVPDICMLSNILSLTSHIQKRRCKF